MSGLVWTWPTTGSVLTHEYSLSSMPIAAGGPFAWRNVWNSKEILYRWHKICPESGQELWLVDVVVILFYLLLRMTDKRQKATKVKCKRDESISQYFSPVLLELVCKRSQNLTIIDQEKHKVKQVNIWNPVTTEFADVPPGETSLEARSWETAVFAG